MFFTEVGSLIPRFTWMSCDGDWNRRISINPRGNIAYALRRG
jgi:hypothetical protein